MNWAGAGAPPQTVMQNLDYLMRLTDPVVQMQGIAQYLAWLNEAMRQDRLLAQQQEQQRNQEITRQRQLEEAALRAQAQLQAQAQAAAAERTASLMQGIGNVAAFFADFVRDNPNVFKIRGRAQRTTQTDSLNPLMAKLQPLVDKRRASARAPAQFARAAKSLLDLSSPAAVFGTDTTRSRGR